MHMCHVRALQLAKILQLVCSPGRFSLSSTLYMPSFYMTDIVIIFYLLVLVIP